MTYHINEGNWFTEEYNDLQQIKLTYARLLGKNAIIFAGPSLNLMISDYYLDGAQRSGSGFVPYSFISQRCGDTSLKYWIGFNAGIRIH